LILASAGAVVLALSLVPSVGRAATPCPPPQLDVDGGTSATTPCTSSSGNYSTNFPLNENPISEGGKWVNGKLIGTNWNNALTVPGRATASVLSGNPSRYNDSIAHLSTSVATFTPNQFAQGVVYKAAGYDPRAVGKHEVELLLRFSITNGVARGYEIGWGTDGYIFLVRWDGGLGSYTALYDPGTGSIPIPQDGDVLRVEIIGNNVSAYRNGVLIAGWPQAVTSHGGTVWTAGQPGMGFWPVDGATPANLGWKTYQAGNL
jgi:hypothetical protein